MRPTLVLCASLWLAQPAITIDLAHGTDRERQTKALLEKVLTDYDLRKYAFARHVVIEERAINHAFPVLTLNVRFSNSADELLSSYIHEQLHWHLREHGSQQQDAVRELRQMYPAAPSGCPRARTPQSARTGIWWTAIWKSRLTVS